VVDLHKEIIGGGIKGRTHGNHLKVALI